MKSLILKLLILLFLSSLFSQCSYLHDDKVINRDFGNRSINLTGEQILDTLYGAIELNVIDTLLFVRVKGGRVLFKVYSSNDLSFVLNLGLYGDGPEEWKAPRYCGQYSKSSTSYSIWFNDIFKQRFMLVKIVGKDVSIVEEYKISPILNLDRDLFYLDSNWLVGNNGMDAIQKARLCYYNPISDSCRFTWDFPDIDDKGKFTRVELFDIYYDHLKMKPDGSSFVSALERFDRIDKINREGIIVKSWLGDVETGYYTTEVSDYKSNKGLKSLNCYYTWLQVTDENIYALYLNQSDDDYNYIPKPVEIHVFDWELNPKYKLLVSDYLLCIAVDEKNGWIYGLDYYNEKILRYNMANIFNDSIIWNYEKMEE